MLAPVLTMNDRPVVVPRTNLMADNFFDAWRLGWVASVQTGYQFTESFIDIDIVKGIHVVIDDVDVVLLSREYRYAREQSETRDI